MKRIGYMAAAALFLASTAFGQAAPTPSGVGLIDFERAVAQNDEGVKAAAQYKDEGKKLADGLAVSQEKAGQLKEKLAKDGPTMSDSDKNALLREIDTENKIYDLEQQKAQATIDDKQEELFRPVADRVHKVVEAYAKELSLGIVVNASQDMVYANDLVDITTEIIRRVNTDIVKNPTPAKK